MILLLSISTVFFIVFHIWLIIGWKALPSAEHDHSQTLEGISVIIPVRNEETTIESILRDLEVQRFSRDLYEVIVVDDFSSDQTVTIVSKLTAALQCNVRLLELEETKENKNGKKIAITKGVEEARFPLIFTTDADCRIGSEFLKTLQQSFQTDVQFVAGPVSMQGNGFFASLQKLEFAILMIFGAVSIFKKSPIMCSGANLAFRKTAFQKVNGYESNLHIPSGDDEFLMQSIFKANIGRLVFIKSFKAIVKTPSHTSIGALINQRIRWTSKWKTNQNPFARIGSILFFIDQLLVLLLLVGCLIESFSLSLFFLFIGIRWYFTFQLQLVVKSFLSQSSLPVAAFFMQLFYPFHMLVMGIASIFGSYTWKGRKF